MTQFKVCTVQCRVSSSKAALTWLCDDISGVSMILVMQQDLALDGATSLFRPAGFGGETRSLRLHVLVFADVTHADEDEEVSKRKIHFSRA